MQFTLQQCRRVGFCCCLGLAAAAAGTAGAQQHVPGVATARAPLGSGVRVESPTLEAYTLGRPFTLDIDFSGVSPAGASVWFTSDDALQLTHAEPRPLPAGSSRISLTVTATATGRFYVNVFTRQDGVRNVISVPVQVGPRQDAAAAALPAFSMKSQAAGAWQRSPLQPDGWPAPEGAGRIPARTPAAAPAIGPPMAQGVIIQHRTSGVATVGQAYEVFVIFGSVVARGAKVSFKSTDPDLVLAEARPRTVPEGRTEVRLLATAASNGLKFIQVIARQGTGGAAVYVPVQVGPE